MYYLNSDTDSEAWAYRPLARIEVLETFRTQNKTTEKKILTIVYDPTIELQFDQEDIITKDLPFQTLRIKGTDSLDND